MKVMLRKVTKTPLDFELKSDEITFKGYLQYHHDRLILLDGRLSGFVQTPCDLCAQEFNLHVDEEIQLFISDGVFKDEGNVELDVVESLDGNINLDELLHSEIELVKSDYHRCESCHDIEELEF